MTTKQHSLLPLFELFVKDSYKGKRVKADGSKIKPQTVDNYVYVLRYLKEFEELQREPIRIRIIKGDNKRVFTAEKNYWRKFYERSTFFLHHTKKCFDNYVGTVIKIIRIFFNWLNKEKGIRTGEFYKSFYIYREEVPIVTLTPDRLRFLLNDTTFHNRLCKPLQKTKSIFVFGCTVALRVSDLFSIKFNDIESVGASSYLPVKTMKTGTTVSIKLPHYALEIIESFRVNAKKRKEIFPPIPRTRFNNQIKEICHAAGWLDSIGKKRSRKGVLIEINKTPLAPDQNCGDSVERKTSKETIQCYRFCDLVSSHTMRRTAITTMLMMGMKEHVVKQISGHAKDSKSFYRYVNLVQPYLDNEMDIVFNKLSSPSDSLQTH